MQEDFTPFDLCPSTPFPLPTPKQPPPIPIYTPTLTPPDSLWHRSDINTLIRQCLKPTVEIAEDSSGRSSYGSISPDRVLPRDILRSPWNHG